MRLESLLHTALDALMYVDSLSLVTNNQLHPYSGILLLHRTRKEDNEDIHIAEIIYRDGGLGHHLVEECVIFPFREMPDFQKLFGLDPDDSSWSLYRGHLCDLKEARADLDELIGYFERAAHESVQESNS